MSTVSDLALRILISAKDDSTPALNSARDRIKSISDQLQQVEKIATRFLSFQIFAGWAKDAAQLNDTYNEIQGKLSQVVGKGEQLASVQERLFKSAQAAGAGLKDTVDLYARSAEALKKLNDGQELAARLTETVNLSFRAQRTNVAEASSTVTQLTQAIGTGTVTWEDFGNVAQSNLLLVNTAAKNLGYDGISSLKQAISEGKISGEQMTRAIVAGFTEIKARADQMPLGITQSMTLINNAMIKFAGESNQVNAAASAVSKTLKFVADSMNELANAALIAAEIYGLRMVTGFAASASAALKASLAIKDKTLAEAMAQAAAQKSIVLEMELAAVRVKAAQTAVTEAQLQMSLADGVKQKKQASDALAKTMTALHGAETQYQNAAKATRAAVDASAMSATLAGRAVGALGAAIRGLPLLGWAIMLADWVTKLDSVYLASMRVQEGLAMAAMRVRQMFTMTSAEDSAAQARQLHAEFNTIIEKNSNAAKQSAIDIKAAEEQKARSTEQAAQAQQVAFAKVQEATKALTAQIDYDAKAQTASIQQALAEKLAAIDAADTNDAAKTAQRTQARMLAAQQELQLQQKAAQAKLELIDQEYQGELQQAANNAQRVKDIETDKRQAKLSVYQGLAEYYAGENQRLTELYAQEIKAFAESKQSLELLAMDHEQKMLDIDRGGMTTRRKISDEQFEFDKNMRLVKAELAKGQAADQDKLNALLKRSGELSQDIYNTEKSNAQSREEQRRFQENYKQRETQIYADRKKLVEDDAKAHQTAAESIAQGLETAKSKLEDANRVIGEMTANLSKDYLLKIGIESKSLISAQAAIADLVKPETKTITIETVNTGGGAPAQATGGLAGQPTGLPWRFSNGGWASRSGKLSGYGGGDKIKALLEAGEFVVRKEAVQKLGVPVLQLINQGMLPNQPIKRASGGLIDAEVEKMMLSDGIEQLKKLLKGHYYDNMDKFFLGDRSNSASNKVSELVRNLGDKLKLPSYVMSQALEAAARLPKAYSEKELGSQAREIAKREDLTFQAALNLIGKVPEQQAAPKIDLQKPVLPKITIPKPVLPKFEMPKLEMPKIPSIKIPTPNVPSLATPAAGGAAMAAGGSGRAVSVEFKLPTGQPATGQFADADVDRLLKVLKDASGYSLAGAR